ncbi:MAG: hypothetical protein U0R70_17505 [Solirubrobacteraceae bacterium]
MPTGPVDDAAWREHPPAGDPPVELGRDMRLTTGLAGREAERIMDACEPRGENFKPARQFGCRYAFVRDLPAAAYEQHYTHWDHDQVLLAGFTLSRLVLDNAYSTEYAARIVEFSDGRVQISPGPVNLEGALAYRAHSGRDWLDADEARQLAALLAAFWEREGSLPERVSNAIWLAEQSARRKYDFDALMTVIAGLEALLNTGPRQNTKQFVMRVPRLAAGGGVSGISQGMARRLYNRRSEPAHGRRLTLIPTPQPGVPAPQHAEQMAAALRELALLQDVLRAAVRRCIEDPDFSAHFADDEGVRAQWPVNDGDGNPL